MTDKRFNNEEAASTLLHDVMKELTLKQLNLSMTKMTFEKRDKEARETVIKVFNDIVKWAHRSQEKVVKHLEEIAAKRRREMEEISAGLICLQPRITLLYESCLKEEIIRKKIEGIRNECQELYPSDACDQLPILTFQLSDLAHKVFDPCNGDQLFPIHSCVRAEELQLSMVSIEPSGTEIRVEIESRSLLMRFPKFLLSEMSVEMQGLDNGDEVQLSVSLKTLLIQGKLCLNTKGSVISFSISIKPPKKSTHYAVDVTLSRSSISGSPLTFRCENRQQSRWEDVGNGGHNITRTGKRTDDLDESDLISMGYKFSDKTLLANLSASLKDPKSSTENGSLLVDPLNSTEKLEGSPLQKQLRMETRVQRLESPLVDRNALNLPLDQPSPLTYSNGMAATKFDANDTDNAPCTSTLNNLSERLQSISFSDLNDDTLQEDKNVADRQTGIENLLRIQRVLTGEVVEESKHDKSVSFHPNTTILEPASKFTRTRRSSKSKALDDLCVTKPYKPSSMDSNSFRQDVSNDQSSIEEQWLISTGLTKTNDGALALCKSILQAQKGHNNHSVDLWSRKIVPSTTTKSKNTEDSPRGDESSLVVNGRCENTLLDLSHTTYSLQLKEQVKLDDRPQMIIKDETRSYLFVSHPNANKISVFTNLKNRKGALETTLRWKYPRYVLPIPKDRVAILDMNGLHIFSNSRPPLKSILTDTASFCRGLEYYKKHRYLLTLQKSTEGSDVLLIDAEVTDTVIQRIHIGPSSITDWHKERTKCLYMACSRTSEKLYVSDYGLNCIYLVNLDTSTTSVFVPTDETSPVKLMEPRGIVLDLEENVIVAGKDHEKLEMYDPHGRHLRTLSVPGAKEMGGLFLDTKDNVLYVSPQQPNQSFSML